jgi:hypothetical protein
VPCLGQLLCYLQNAAVKNHLDHRYDSRTSGLMMSRAEAATLLCAELQIALQKCIAGEFFRSLRKRDDSRNKPQPAKSGLQSIKNKRGSWMAVLSSMCILLRLTVIVICVPASPDLTGPEK